MYNTRFNTQSIIRPHRVPRILPLSPGVLPRWSQEGGKVFRVLAEGSAGDIDLARGDLLLTRGEAPRGEMGVLIPRGYGRPMLGCRTDGGLRAEPGGVHCSPDRWAMAGRLVARARSFRIRPRSGEVLRGQSEEVVEYPAGLGASTGRWVALDLGAPASPELHEWLTRRLTRLQTISPTRVIGECAWVFDGCPLLRSGALIAELRDHFGLRVSAGAAGRLDAAVAAMGLALPGSVVAVEAGAEAEFVAPLPVTAAAQLALFVAA